MPSRISPKVVPQGTSRRPSAARRSGGPRTPSGKRRSSLNALRRGLCPPWVAEDLRVHGENPDHFSRLHRELIAWLRPVDARTRVVVETLAEVWWEKIRLLRGSPPAARPDTEEIDARIEILLVRFVIGMRAHTRKWLYRLVSTFRYNLPSPYSLRLAVEARLGSLGGRPRKRVNKSMRVPGLRLAHQEVQRQYYGVFRRMDRIREWLIVTAKNYVSSKWISPVETAKKPTRAQLSKNLPPESAAKTN